MMNSNRKYGIGGSTIEAELQKLQRPKIQPEPIQAQEFEQRLKSACTAMKAAGFDALYLDAGTNLYYFTGTKWNASERLVGAILFADGKLYYVVPEFEIGTFSEYMGVQGSILSWQEHESPVEKIAGLFENKTVLGVDDSTPFNLVSRFQNLSNTEVKTAEKLIRDQRMIKSEAEIAQLQYAMNLTLEVHKATARILKPGITTAEVVDFIHSAHKKMGIETGSYFCIVLFGKDSSFPHGVKSPKPLEDGDIVLVDTGCMFNGYISDITRTYSYGDASEKMRKIWEIEKEAQFKAFDASKLGNTCGNVDDSVREKLEEYDLGPGYELPGLPHRTGHGIGLEIHENPYILGGNDIEIKEGMCFSIEPMLVIPDEFGVRLEDHVYMTKNGPEWFTKPAKSIENPFDL